VRELKLLFRVHAVQRMFARGISVKKARSVLDSGEIIEDYSAEMPEPSRLLLGFQGKHPFHVVVSENQKENVMTVITVYKPDSNYWNKDFKSRRA
jgi:hypothetical protein